MVFGSFYVVHRIKRNTPGKQSAEWVSAAGVLGRDVLLFFWRKRREKDGVDGDEQHQLRQRAEPARDRCCVRSRPPGIRPHFGGRAVVARPDSCVVFFPAVVCEPLEP